MRELRMIFCVYLGPPSPSFSPLLDLLLRQHLLPREIPHRVYILLKNRLIHRCGTTDASRRGHLPPLDLRDNIGRVVEWSIPRTGEPRRYLRLVAPQTLLPLHLLHVAISRSKSMRHVPVGLLRQSIVVAGRFSSLTYRTNCRKGRQDAPKDQPRIAACVHCVEVRAARGRVQSGLESQES